MPIQTGMTRTTNRHNRCFRIQWALRLTPYLFQLDERWNVRDWIAFSHYGEPALVNDIDYKESIEYWKPKNDA